MTAIMNRTQVAMHKVTYIDASGEKVTSSFRTRDEAWDFMHLCDVHGVQAGFPFFSFN
jgi:hypothetical protein